MSNVTKILYHSGILKPNDLLEFGRWGAPVEVLSESPAITGEHNTRSMKELVKQLIEALDVRDLQLDHIYDLEALKEYEESAQKATLVLTRENGKKSRIAIEVGISRTGDVIIPWQDDSIAEEMTNGYTYIKVGEKKMWFSRVRDIFVYDTPMFMLCTPGVDEGEDGDE